MTVTLAGRNVIRARHAQLLALSDTREVRDLGEARARIAAIAETFAEQADPRGVGCYLDNLHRHLREEKPTPPWEAVYRHCDTDPVSITAIVAAALNAHLISDLPEALHASAVRPHHFLDYQTLSRRILATASTALAAIEGVYGIDLSPMYHAKPLTWPMNTLIGRTAATQEQLFQIHHRYRFRPRLGPGKSIGPAINSRPDDGRFANAGFGDRSTRSAQHRGGAG